MESGWISSRSCCAAAVSVKLVLGVACGTRYELAADAAGLRSSAWTAADMLAAAISKGGETSGVPPVFLHPVHAEAEYVQYGGRGSVLSGQSQL